MTDLPINRAKTGKRTLLKIAERNARKKVPVTGASEAAETRNGLSGCANLRKSPDIAG
jgi:hypothetical protein